MANGGEANLHGSSVAMVQERTAAAAVMGVVAPPPPAVADGSAGPVFTPIDASAVVAVYEAKSEHASRSGSASSFNLVLPPQITQATAGSVVDAVKATSAAATSTGTTSAASSATASPVILPIANPAVTALATQPGKPQLQKQRASSATPAPPNYRSSIVSLPHNNPSQSSTPSNPSPLSAVATAPPPASSHRASLSLSTTPSMLATGGGFLDTVDEDVIAATPFTPSRTPTTPMLPVVPGTGTRARSSSAAAGAPGTAESPGAATPGRLVKKLSVRSRSEGSAGFEAAGAGTRQRGLTRQRSEKEVLVGTPVKEGHVNYMLMYDMLTGIRVSVSRCNAKPVRPLEPEDFQAAHKLAFDVTGNELTPSSRYDFKFKDYAPWVFRMIREAFCVDPSEYLLSLTGKYVLSELGSPGKSGSFFYFSQDYRFIIKTIHHSEHKFTRQILSHYYAHIKANPQTLLSRIFGLHRVKLPGNKKIHFVVMGNVFPPNKDIHETYDLKGSSVGRIISEKEEAKNPRAVLKDLNWLQKGRKLKLGPEKETQFVEQMERDVAFLTSMKIMDYSLLVGYHDLVKGNADNIRDTTLQVVEPNPETLSRLHSVSLHHSVHQSATFGPGVTPAVPAPNSGANSGTATPTASAPPPPGLGTPSLPTAPAVGSDVPTTPINAAVAAVERHGTFRRSSKASAMRRTLAEVEPVRLGPSSARLPDDSPPERSNFLFYRELGGLRATGFTNEPLQEVYYIGIIDIFTKYDATKKAEHFFKSLTANSKKISAVKPPLYGQRFLAFMKNAIARPGDPPAVPLASAMPSSAAQSTSDLGEAGTSS
ncbi:Phosphatidylinositol-4-phosphate 5-kinase [Phlyctochytrium bullatum]|nr:Phosphatidylinositol-4-phosphate 5-kinase [Phlyctochytrium bullatum]